MWGVVGKALGKGFTFKQIFILHLVSFGSSSGVSGYDKSSKLIIKSDTSSACIGAITSEHKNFVPKIIIIFFKYFTASE